MSNFTNTNFIPYHIARISSFDRTHASFNCDSMSIGKNHNGYKSRVLIKFIFNGLPKNIRISRAFLAINVLNCTVNEITGYPLNSDWNIHTVNWNNQPPINLNYKLFAKSISACKKYYIDITNQVRNWYNYPYTNYGLALIGSELSCSNKILICTKKDQIINYHY